ncbi:serine hydrolase domain-containing protein [Microbacter margulisiae]|uniref:CubicO group peptidase (Beta-lactamase class C family) n=1 Tax=Microbacter margulisiae TaxID=1350067 RepID=A0A7W5DRQ0_9PORP|nr:serine hydrolase domain-containing protein [Microbacter margulisiae]MBB3187852.1 CubicO group peptidase (beta-lactamase class C family) [Microbacter margulisiae]
MKLFPVIFLTIFFIGQTGNSCFARNTGKETLPEIEKATFNPDAPPIRSLHSVGMSATILARISAIARTGIRAHAYPGCQILVVKDGKMVYEKCFGYYTYAAKKKVTPSTMYDLASLSKTTGTLLAIMKLYDKGKLKLTDRASKYLSFLRGTDKTDITIEELLFHESGLPASIPLYNLAIAGRYRPSLIEMSEEKTKDDSIVFSHEFQFKEGFASSIPSPEFSLQVGKDFYVNKQFHDAAMKMIADTPLKSKVYRYSDLNFILLEEIAEKISGKPMDVFLNREFYDPMGLNNIDYLPLRTHSKSAIAPTLKRDFLRNGILQGYVNDPNAAILGGVAGNAGLFATARDVAAVYQMLLNQGELNGKRYLSERTCRIFTTTTSASGRRGLGYDKPVPNRPGHSPCCVSAPREVYGHTGYTGTCCWVDPVNDMIYIFLSNRTYPLDGINKLMRMGIRSKIQEILYQSIDEYAELHHQKEENLSSNVNKAIMEKMK